MFILSLLLLSSNSFILGFALVLTDFEGKTLNHVLAERTLNLREFLKIALDLALVLGRLHAKGIIHKDIKPSNVKYNKNTGKVQLIDFGISSRLNVESYHTSLQPHNLPRTTSDKPRTAARRRIHHGFEGSHHSAHILFALLSPPLSFFTSVLKVVNLSQAHLHICHRNKRGV